MIQSMESIAEIEDQTRYAAVNRNTVRDNEPEDEAMIVDHVHRGRILNEPRHFCECRSNLKPLGYRRSDFCIGCMREMNKEDIRYRRQWRGQLPFRFSAPCAEAGCTTRVLVQKQGRDGLPPASSQNVCSWCCKIVAMDPWVVEKEAPFRFPDKSLCGPIANASRPAVTRSRRVYNNYYSRQRHYAATNKETLMGPLPSQAANDLASAHPNGFRGVQWDIEQFGSRNELWVPNVTPSPLPELGPNSSETGEVGSVPPEPLVEETLLAHEPGAGTNGQGPYQLHGREGGEQAIITWMDNVVDPQQETASVTPETTLAGAALDGAAQAAPAAPAPPATPTQPGHLDVSRIPSGMPMQWDPPSLTEGPSVVTTPAPSTPRSMVAHAGEEELLVGLSTPEEDSPMDIDTSEVDSSEHSSGEYNPYGDDLYGDESRAEAHERSRVRRIEAEMADDEAHAAYLDLHPDEA